MQLKNIKLINFRGYSHIDIEIGSGLQMFVGKNDIGKSTVFEALDIFFNDKNALTKITIDDLNILSKNEGNNKIKINCCFEIEDTDKIHIEEVCISPTDEYLLNQDGFLEVSKTWECPDSGTLKLTTFIVCNVPKAIPHEIFSLKQSDLRKKIKEFGLEDKANQNINSSMRRAIYDNYIEKSDNDSKINSEIPTKSFLGEKDILDNISKSFPDFYLFKADRKNSTSDDEIQNPLSLAVKRAFEDVSVKEKIAEIEEIIRKQLNEVNIATIDKLQELNVDYGNNLIARINTNWTSAVKNDILDGNEIPINKRGSGIRRLLLLSYLMVEAEKKSFNNYKKNIIFAIEEPETALHPFMQKKFIKQLMKLAEKNRYEFGYEMPTNASELNRYQVLITTHLPNFISYANTKNIVYLYKENTTIKRYQNEDIKDFIQNEMGKLPIVEYKYIIFVEGDNDCDALRNLGQIEELRKIFDINDSSINIVPLKGSNLLKCIECDYYWDLPVKQYHLYDSDIEKYKTEVIDVKCNTEENKLVRGRVTELKEMENYIPKPLIECAIGIDLDTYKDKWQNQDFDIVSILLSQPDTSVEQFNKIRAISNYKEREKAMKNYLNRTVLTGVTRELLVEHGVFEEIKKWFEEMKELHDFVE